MKSAGNGATASIGGVGLGGLGWGFGEGRAERDFLDGDGEQQEDEGHREGAEEEPVDGGGYAVADAAGGTLE